MALNAISKTIFWLGAEYKQGPERPEFHSIHQATAPLEVTFIGEKENSKSLAYAEPFRETRLY